MTLPPEETTLFIGLYSSFIGFVAGELGGIDGITDWQTFDDAPIESKGIARDKMLENLDLIEKYIDDDPYGFKQKDLSRLFNLKRFIKDRFIIERALKRYTVFLKYDDMSRAYGVLGLFDEISNLIRYPLPAMVEAVLLPWNDIIICDGLIRPYGIQFGPGVRSDLKEWYNQAKNSGIITSLDPNWKPEFDRKPQRVAKTPAIKRFLKRCPQKLSDFKEKYGAPKKIIASESMEHCGIWDIKGNPVVDCDAVLLYPNIIKDKTLYIYLKDESIVSVLAVDTIEWNKKDLRPHPGRSILK